MKKLKSKRIIRQIVSVFAAIVFIVGSIPLGEVTNGLLPLFSLRAHAEYSPTHPAGDFSNNTHSFTFSDVVSFVDFSWHYQNTEGFAAAHCNDTLSIGFTDSQNNELSADYAGLGTDTYPFGGTLILGGDNYNIRLHSALFKYVYDSVEFLNARSDAQTIVRDNMVLQRLSDVGDGENKPLLAEHVRRDTRAGKSPALSWSVELHSANSKTYSGLIGELESGAVVTLIYNNASASPADVLSSADVGAVCGKMCTGSSLDLTYTAASGTAFGITSSGGNAGGIVGTMEGDASLTINSAPSLASSVKSTAASKYAGGLVGELTSEAMITNSTNSILSVGGSAESAEGAGGLFGHYTNSKTEFDLKDYNITSTVYGKYCGGVFGVLENNKADGAASLELTVKNTGSAGTVNVSSGTDTTYGTTGSFGGVMGKYESNALANSLKIDSLTVTVDANTQFDSYGGVIGLVDSAAYVTTNGTVTVNATGTDDSVFFGGFVGSTSSNDGVFVNLGNFTLSNNNEQFNGGGVVGRFNNGVLRLDGTTDMTNAKCACADNCGQLVGKNDNVLVYATGTGASGSGWVFNRSNGSEADDLGTWGEVVRVNNIETDVLTYNSTAHTVTVKQAVTDMSTQADLVRTALNIQLNQGSGYNCLLFTSGSRDALLASTSTLSLSSDISLVGSGITGLMRDGGDVSAIGSFTGTFNGNSHKITLATGEEYGVTGASAEGKGQIYRHQHNGLFAVLGGTVNSLTVDGDINVRNKVFVSSSGAGVMNIGGVASRNGGNVTLDGVNTNVTVNYHEGTNITTYNNTNPDKNIGGYIGYVGADGTIDIIGNSSIGAHFNFSGHHESWNNYGGVIGKIAAQTFIVNVGTTGKLTNGLVMDASGITDVGGNSDGGGLIGYIADKGSYGSRVVNLNNLEYDGCTLYNSANTNGGGLLGYSWLNTTANITGVKVTSATINNVTTGTTAGGNENVGAMCYSATGKWIVDSLDVDELTVSGGRGTSLGLIVNKAYNGDKGLYLDVLNAGYTLNASGITLPGTIDVYDEIAAYSASNVINGGNGAGVVSINMNADRSGTEVKTTVTGTYQNQLTSTSSAALGAAKYANPNTRYYYNIDKMSTADDGQDLMLWSLKKYAASNISGEFVSNMNTTISGNADLTGLSFYPLKNGNGYTIGNLTLKFDYDGIRNTAETTFGASNPTDGYLRDPVEKNQHYLMHSGLFIDVPGSLLTAGSNNKLTISGKLSVSGTFMEDDTHKGVLISGTMYGDLDCTGSIELDGITPKNGANTYENYGYLLINNITREGDLYFPPTLNLNNVSTTKEYSTAAYTAGSTNARVAKSLIGPASGKGLKFELSGIKLDARDGSKNDVKLEALYDAYGTYNSIFTDSTLFASIYTDVNASLEYNYTYDEDWGAGNRNVTYGKEVKDSVEYRTNDTPSESKENRYYGAPRNYTNPINNADTEYDFSTGFLPYVNTGFTAVGTQYYRELKVNVMTEGLIEGCGSYNDPYIIRKGSILENVAKFIQSGSTGDLSRVVLPVNYGNFDTLAENTSGSRWCTDKTGTTYHDVYVPNAGGTGYVRENGGDSAWTDLNNVRYYLANAYYMIADDIELSDAYVGLGSMDPNNVNSNFAFRGVIVGRESGSALDTITNKSDKPFINVSNGCVVKDINIKVNKNITLLQDNNTTANAYFGYDSKCSYYGGIIGEVMGGDIIIDNSYVTYDNSTVTLTGTSSTIVPVGGYVGVVVFGGVIFKNMTASKTTAANTNLTVKYTGKSENLADNDKQEDWAAIYVNPIVGRVINGYAVNETTQFSTSEDGHYHDDGNTTRTGTTTNTLQNGKKHYTITDININNANKLDVTAATSSADGTINVPDAQALFILSLITQSTAGTAQNSSSVLSHNETTVETSRTTDESGNVTINQTRTVTDILGLSDYSNSLSYGTNNGSVYGMCHTASYNEVGESTSSDYNTYVCYDTAANTALPYIIMHYTVGSTGTTTATTIATSTVGGTTEDSIEIFDGTDPNGKEFFIHGTGRKGENCYLNIKEIITKDYTGPKAINVPDYNTLPDKNLTKVLFTKVGTTGNYYTISYNDNGTDYYLAFNGNSRNLSVSTTPYSFTVVKNSNEKWDIGHTTATESNNYLNVRNETNFVGQGNGDLVFYEEIEANPITITTITTTNTTTTTVSYPARCVTSTLGYYDINLTANVSYQLPDSFRGLGSVGMNAQAYAMKVNTFSGNGCTIDEDIYLNKFATDNYLNVTHTGSDQNCSTNTVGFGLDAPSQSKEAHGIGLFDSIFTKGNTSKITNFTLTGSVKTAIFSNSYTAGTKELSGVNNSYLWLSVGGVCGFAKGNQWVCFDTIHLNDFKVNGSCYVAGLLAQSSNNTTSMDITIIQCDADNISLKMAAAMNSTGVYRRDAMGTFVGKVKQGKVVVYGTSLKENNNNTASFKTVNISAFELGDTTNNYTLSAGGLVGYSGHGFECYDMMVIGNDVTIGGTGGISGGIVGHIQPYSEGNDEAEAVFKNCTVQNANIKGSYSGGIYGGKWDSEWVPYKLEFINCKVEDTTPSSKCTIYGEEYSGGLVGRGKIYTRNGNDANITIADCAVDSYIIDAPANKYAGGFIGHCTSVATAITCYIHDSSVENCIIGSTAGSIVGGAIGFLEKGPGAKNNNVVVTPTVDDNKLLGYNIMLKNVTSSSVNNGTWIGKIDSNLTQTIIQFAGLAVYGNRFSNTANVYSGTTANASFVFSSYEETGNLTVTSDYLSTYNYAAGTHVVMPKYPYVNVNPISDMGGSVELGFEHISGDGAVLYNSNTTMAAKIYADRSDNNNTRRYSTFEDTEIVANSGKYIEDYLNQTAGGDGDRISTFETEKGVGALPAGVDDFAVIVINNQSGDETTDLINRYIQLVTNTTTDYTLSSSYYSVVIAQCKYDTTDNRFEIVPNAAGSILYTAGTGNNSGSFTVNNARADSAYVDLTFTLIDVQFKDPLDTNKIAYHLYVPVYTIKQLEVEFSTVVRTGSHSFADDLPTTHTDSDYLTNGTHVDSLKTWITHYIRYSYDSDTINAFLNANDVSWNNSKSVIFQTGRGSTTFQRLPENTVMILVDPNGNSDKMYYAEKLWDEQNNSGFDTYVDVENTNSNNEGWIIAFDKFTDTGGNSYTTKTLNDLIAADIVVSTTEGDKLYIAGSANDYDVYVINNGVKEYYKYAASGVTPTHSLSVPSNYTANEDYYLTMYVPDSDELHFYEVIPPDELSGDRKTIKVNMKNSYTVIVADLYEQTTSLIVEPDDLQINANNKEITVKPTTSISLINGDARIYLSGESLYHSFKLSLNRYYEDAVLDEIIGLTGTSITATYEIGSTTADENSSAVLQKDLQNNYLNIVTADIMSDLLDAAYNVRPLQISSYIVLDFDQTKLEDEFPEKTSEATIGVNVAATSNLAYEQDRLAYTSMVAPFAADGHYYYRESVNSAKLDYNALSELDRYDTIGRESYNQSRLGVNGYPENCSEYEFMPINTEAKYNVSAISELDLDRAQKLRLTVTLSKKTDTVENNIVTGAEYVQVSDMSNYIHSALDPNDSNSALYGVHITSGTMYGTNGEGVTHYLTPGSGSLVVEIPKENCDVLADIYTIGLGFEIKTGASFTEYANYKITLSTELIYTENGLTKTVENSGVSDYIVYTNAKIIPSTVNVNEADG